MKNNIKTLIVLALIAFKANAQQDPLYTQYMYNMSVVNPAYTTGEEGSLDAGLIHRNQWVNLPADINTTSLFLHTALSEKIETGLSVTHDNVDDVIKNTNVYADFAYRIDMEENGSLSFGIKAGATLFETNYGALNVFGTDLAFENSNATNFNIGAGAFYNNERFYVGLSIPQILKPDLGEEINSAYPNVSEMHSYLTAGFVFNLSENLKFKPATMVRVVEGAPISFDITGNFLIMERFEIGAAYRHEDAVSGLLNFRIIDTLRIGYAYDYTISDLDNSNTGGSHEFLLLYDLNLLSKKHDKSPRFF